MALIGAGRNEGVKLAMLSVLDYLLGFVQTLTPALLD
jgi:hypothetical protein